MRNVTKILLPMFVAWAVVVSASASASPNVYGLHPESTPNTVQQLAPNSTNLRFRQISQGKLLTVERAANSLPGGQTLYRILNAQGMLLSVFSVGVDSKVQVLTSGSWSKGVNSYQTRYKLSAQSVHCPCNVTTKPIQGTDLKIIKVTGTNTAGQTVLLSVSLYNINTGDITVIYDK